ncbi:MAG: sulfatase-like hydrolase/transferase [Bacteroidales bacterium]|jgi:arylsulfatase A-like enzyme|nr:sulfatase-like hydrolase/transferase [Bacteroidales bacterium]MDD3914909.1 sulfatase-like hydrolase/transferase [Bacteroidales bacterium]MDD4634761.1 sulfatase-like hydrolase/transferase [Bacteroidales bacterium]
MTTSKIHSKLSVMAIAAAGCCLYSCADKSVQSTPETSRPNVIFIYADDLGKGMISAYGQQQFRTPTIDSLISRGISYNNAYGCMLSAPARASLLTGYHDCNTDKWKINNGGQFLWCKDSTDIAEVEKSIDAEDIILFDNDLYLPEVFKKAGYVTAQVGKLEWGFTASHKQMRRHGWDYYYGYLDHVRCHGYYPPFLFDNGKMTFIEGNTRSDCGKTLENETPQTYADRWNMDGKNIYSQDLFTDKIIELLHQYQDTTFFIYHPTQLPHGPVAIPKVHPSVADNPNLTSLEKEYASMVIMIDETVQIIWKELIALGLEDNTIIIFSADNGHEIYYSQTGRCEKPYRNMKTGELFDDFNDKYYSELSGDIFNGNAGMAGLKRSNLEGGIHIPLVFYWKNHLPEGETRNDIVSNYDLLPTMAELLNIQLDSNKDGKSYLDNLFNNTPIDTAKCIIVNSFYGPAVIMNNGWKLRYFKAADTYELYNLRDDPREEHNVITKFPAIADTLQTCDPFGGIIRHRKMRCQTIDN